MFRPIRKKNNEISADKINELLCSSRRGVLAINGEEGYPYAIPINYIYDDINGKIYFHSSRIGYKIDALKKCDKICFTVIGQEIVKKEKWAPYVKSVIVFGRCYPIENREETKKRLKQFAMKYYPNEQMVDEEINGFEQAVQMFEIIVEHISGKEVQER